MLLKRFHVFTGGAADAPPVLDRIHQPGLRIAYVAAQVGAARGCPEISEDGPMEHVRTRQRPIIAMALNPDITRNDYLFGQYHLSNPTCPCNPFEVLAGQPPGRISRCEGQRPRRWPAPKRCR